MSIQCIKLKDLNPAIHTPLSAPSKFGCAVCETNPKCGCIKKNPPCSCWDQIFSVEGGSQVIGIPKSLLINVTCCVKCAGKCCDEGQKCLKNSGGNSVCCSETSQCGNKCCDDGMICKNGECCYPDCCDGCCFCSFSGSWGCGSEGKAACEAFAAANGYEGLFYDNPGGDVCGCTMYAKIDCSLECSTLPEIGLAYYSEKGVCCGGECTPAVLCSSSSSAPPPPSSSTSPPSSSSSDSDPCLTGSLYICDQTQNGLEYIQHGNVCSQRSFWIGLPKIDGSTNNKCALGTQATGFMNENDIQSAPPCVCGSCIQAAQFSPDPNNGYGCPLGYYLLGSSPQDPNAPTTPAVYVYCCPDGDICCPIT